ncbi:hypothetical protein [Wansuia hejianensis]|uniref:Uncharacterized protein n=1 Tax=Wansuia hejianensis TaxID=2763667 RepID=A0A926EY48_9FIRM|nr:hypothetical protein [Wansuia hejianensis]MBC8590645.1 hypothetical protein [Wansuia hejianensis]
MENKLIKPFENVAGKVTIRLCQMYHALGFDCVWNDGKDLTLIQNEKDLSAPQQK